MAGEGDIEKLRRMLNLVFHVFDCHGDSKHRHFSNDVFVKRLWNTLNELQKQWLVRNGFVDKDVISVTEGCESGI